MTTRTSAIALALVGALCVTGCASSVRIAEIKTDPGRYDRKTVAVRGTVTSTYGVALVPFQYYNVDDGTGEIAVLSRSSRSMPAKGAQVEVKGRVGEVASFGGRSIGLHIEEDSRKAKY
jgi:DNA/RNA endonuclease YhcR with UshA esterase domain